MRIRVISVLVILIISVLSFLSALYPQKMYDIRLGSDTDGSSGIFRDHLGRDVFFRSLGAEYRLLSICAITVIYFLIIYSIFRFVRKKRPALKTTVTFLKDISLILPLVPFFLFMNSVGSGWMILSFMTAFFFLSARHEEICINNLLRESCLLVLFTTIIVIDVEFFTHIGPAPSFGNMLAAFKNGNADIMSSIIPFCILLLHITAFGTLVCRGEKE
ncbi:MAG: hypothetical protein ACOCWO_02755 [Candidatus Muiribacteriaceae bacterium]